MCTVDANAVVLLVIEVQTHPADDELTYNTISVFSWYG